MTTINSIDARFAQTQVGIASAKVTASVQNLVSGVKADANVADLSVGTVLASRVNTLRVAVGNAGQGKSVLNTAKGALNTILNLLQQQKSLSVKAADDSLSDNERGFLNQEFQAITTQIDRIAATTNFNGKKLLDGSIDGTGASIANLTTTTGIVNEQYSLLNAKDTTASGTVATGNLQDSLATIGKNVITFGAASATATVTVTLDPDASTGSVAAQTITYTKTNTETAAQTAARFVAAATATTAGSEFQKFSYIDNADGTVTIKAKEAGANLNNYTILTDSATATGTVSLGGALIDTGGIARTMFSGTGTAGAEGIFKVVAANNIADTAFHAALTFGADTIGGVAGSVNGVKRVGDAEITTPLASSGGTLRTSTFTITTPGTTGGSTVAFGGVTITINAVDSATSLDAGVYTTLETQASRLADLFNAQAALGTGTTDDYVFSSDGAGSLLATRKASGTAAELFVITAGGGALASTGGVVNVAGVANTNDTIAFAGVTITTREAGYNQIDGQTLGATDLDLGTYTTAAAQATRIAEILNSQGALGTGTSENYTYAVTGGTHITATAKNFGTPGTEAFAIGGGAGGVIDITGSIAGSAGVATTTDITFTIRDEAGTVVGEPVNIVIAANTGTDAYTAAQMAGFFVDSLNDANSSATRLFTFTNNNDGTVGVVAKDAGTKINAYSFDIDQGGVGATFTSTLTGALDIVAVDRVLNTVAAANLGTNKNIATGDLTFDAGLTGALTNLKATFTLGAGNDGISDDNNNTVQFTVDVGGKTYTSQAVQLIGSSSNSTVSNTIKAGTILTFQNASGPTDTNGAFTNAGFQIGIEDATTLSSVTNSSTGQSSLNSIVAGLQTQLSSITINQNRSISLAETNALDGDHTIKAATGTILAGIKGFDSTGVDRLDYNYGDISITSNLFADVGTHGRVGQFKIDATNDTITTTINGEIFTAYLNSGTAPVTGGVQVFGKDTDGTTNNGTYSSTTKILTLGAATGNTAKLNFYSQGITDGRVLTIDLKNVVGTSPTISIATEAKQTTLTDALNVVFGVATADSVDSSLSFQVGVASTDTIGVIIGSAQTDNIYKDEDGVAQVIAVDTKAHAIQASDILDRALNKVVSLVSTVSASITSFDASIQNNNSSVQNADAARSTLTDTDYTTESTAFAEARVRVDAATAVLAQINTRAANLLQLLRQ